MKTRKTISIILTLAAILSLCSCFTATITIQMPEGAVAEATADDVSAGTAQTDSAPQDEESEAAESSSDAETTVPDTEAPAVSEAPAADTTEAPATEPSESAAPVAATPDKMSNEELLKFFNSSLNAVKSDKVGFKKSKLTSILDLQLSNSAANTLVGFVKGALLSETADETTVNKGESGVDVLSPSGKTYSSSLTLSDIKSISCTPSGDSYIIKVAVKDETNPVEGGTLSKVFDFMTVDDVVNIYAPKVGATVAKDDIEVVFSDCTATLTVNADGRVSAYTTYVKGVMNMYNASIKKVVTINTDLAITLASTTEYTDFSY